MSQRYFYTDNRRSNFSGTESPTFDDSEVNIYNFNKINGLREASLLPLMSKPHLMFYRPKRGQIIRRLCPRRLGSVKLYILYFGDTV